MTYSEDIAIYELFGEIIITDFVPKNNNTPINASVVQQQLEAAYLKGKIMTNNYDLFLSKFVKAWLGLCDRPQYTLNGFTFWLEGIATVFINDYARNHIIRNTSFTMRTLEYVRATPDYHRKLVQTKAQILASTKHQSGQHGTTSITVIDRWLTLLETA